METGGSFNGAVFKSIIDMDIAPIVVCSLEHKIIYMNPAAAKAIKKSGGYGLVGKSLLDCHNNDSVCKIKSVIKWFMKAAAITVFYISQSEAE